MNEVRMKRLEEKYSRDAGISKKEFNVSGKSSTRSRAMQSHGKPKETKKTVIRLAGYFSEERPLIILALVCAALSTIFSLAASYMLRPIINDYIENYIGNVTEGMKHLVWAVALLAAIYFVSILNRWLRARIMLTASQRALRKMRHDLFRKLQKLPVRYFDHRASGDLMSRFINDVDTVGDMLNTTLIPIVSGIIMIVGTVVLMLITNVWLALITIVFTPLLLWVSKSIVRHGKEPFSKRQRALGTLNGFAEEMISGQKAVKVFGREDAAEEEFDYLNEQLCKTNIKAKICAEILGPVTHNICNFIYALTACVGSILVVTKGFDIGGLTVSVNYTRKFNQPINEISTQINVVFAALAGAERVFEVMDEAEEPPEEIPAELPKIRGDIILDHVFFGYNPDRVILKDISLHTAPGQKVAFVGSTGAGKTTVTKLLSRFYDIEQGSITVDGVPIDKIPRPILRSNIAMVLQDTHLFTGTVRENIRYGRLDATDEEVEAAAKVASAHDFIVHLEHGYDTVLEHDGANLSQGQRQLLNIARAAISRAPILILDEATSSVDTRTERNIEIGMDALMEHRTTFVIAHRLSTVRKADQIMVLEKGEIIERGNHRDLLSQGGRYADLYHEIAELE